MVQRERERDDGSEGPLTEPCHPKTRVAKETTLLARFRKQTLSLRFFTSAFVVFPNCQFQWEDINRAMIFYIYFHKYYHCSEEIKSPLRLHCTILIYIYGSNFMQKAFAPYIFIYKLFIIIMIIE